MRISSAIYSRWSPIFAVTYITYTEHKFLYSWLDFLPAGESFNTRQVVDTAQGHGCWSMLI